MCSHGKLTGRVIPVIKVSKSPVFGKGRLFCCCNNVIDCACTDSDTLPTLTLYPHILQCIVSSEVLVEVSLGRTSTAADRFCLLVL